MRLPDGKDGVVDQSAEAGRHGVVEGLVLGRAAVEETPVAPLTALDLAALRTGRHVFGAPVGSLWAAFEQVRPEAPHPGTTELQSRLRRRRAQAVLAAPEGVDDPVEEIVGEGG